MSQPAPESVPAEPKPSTASSNRWAIGIVVAVVLVVGVCVARMNSNSKPSAADEQRDAQRVCEGQFVPARLKAPATAKFSGVSVYEAGGAYRVTGSVDSQNGFGALVRSAFSCTVHASGDRWVLDRAEVTG
ncbi:hypothetical protein [Actinoplanes palleronii]|uniref:Uncharacterized protein n=1 Tax=Actinoplanes palleronii TaxID=113570 RepID=A0ABQ4BJ56_9ACTN|nr:hypothetical protein [Actinoplanes palleronii]GIE70715.1 hypothetical protein Apa02nite_068230 [Actinoplanes palleronii]